MNKKEIKEKRSKLDLRKKRVFKKVAESGRLRLCVRRSLKHIHAQVIDDAKRISLAAVCDLEIEKKGKKPVEVAREVGTLIAKKAIEKGAKEVVFDRGSAKYHGRIKAVADGAREAGLEF